MTTSDIAQDLTEKLVKEIQSIAEGPIPAEVDKAGKQCILDWFGIAIAGAQRPEVWILMDESDADCGHSGCAIVGTKVRTTPSVAALVNGFAGDVLDYSDHNLAMHGHPTACVLPAALAIGEARRSSGALLLRSFILGIETACRVGNMFGIDIMPTAFHPTAAFGSFGAMAAVGKQLGLDTQGWRNALAIAATQAAGLKASAGSMCKPFHAGKAAANGLLAARLAKRGFTGAKDVMEHRVGYIAGHTRSGATHPLSKALNDDRGKFLILETTTKDFAACRLTHGTILNMMKIRNEQGVSPDDVAAIELQVPPPYLNICNVAAPATSLEAKFSLRATAALAMFGYDMGQPSSYDEQTVLQPKVSALRDRVSVVARKDLDFEVSVANVRTKDGKELSAMSDDRDTDVDLDRRDARGEVKFRKLVTPVLGESSCSELLDMIRGVERLKDIGELMSVFGPQDGRAGPAPKH